LNSLVVFPADAASIAKSRLIGQNSKYGTRSRRGSEGRFTMHRAANALLKSASVIALLSGCCLLLPSPASAQFPNFPGIQFRVPYMGGGGGGHYRSRHHRTQESSRHRSKSEPEEGEPEEHTAQGNGKS